VKIYYLNGAPPVKGMTYIREGRCMQKTSSWSAIWPPVSLAGIAALTRKNRDVRFIDCNVEGFDNEGLLLDISDFKPDVIIMTSGFPSIKTDMKIANEIKRFLPNVIIVGIGVYFTLLEKKSIIDYPQIDFASVGEPEMTVKELLDTIEQNSNDFSRIKGLLYHEAGVVKYTGFREYIMDMDALPFPARGLLRNERYTLPHNGRSFTLISFCRGCPYPCIFCIAPAYYGKKYRMHSVDYLIKEVKECVKKFSIKDFLFWGEAFTINRDFCLSMCKRLIKEDLGIEWSTTTRADAIDKELLLRMKEANCQLLGLGIESASQDILDKAKKKESIEDIKRAVVLCNEVGIRTMGHFIFGLPGETHETAKDTIKFIKSLKLDYIQCYNAVPYPKTELFDYAKANNLITSSDWSDFDFGGHSIMRTKALSEKDIDRYRVKAFRAFYLRPSFLLKQLFVIKPSKLLKTLQFFNWIDMGKRGKNE
jgi:anaerobic magnesium-protoporphyrin IX monomethyl ester cyclase